MKPWSKPRPYVKVGSRKTVAASATTVRSRIRTPFMPGQCTPGSCRTTTETSGRRNYALHQRARVRPLALARVDLFRPGDLLFLIEQSFFPLGQPTGGPRNREQHRKE